MNRLNKDGRNEDIQSLRDLLAKLHLLNADQTNIMVDVLREVKKGGYSNSDLADIGYFLREIENLADEIRKECAAKKEFIGRYLCLIVAKRATENPNAGLIVRGEFTTSSADIKKAAKQPKFGTPEYALLCKHFGIDEATQKTGAIQFHYTHLSQYLSEMLAAGKEVPEGITTTYDIYRMIWRKRR